MSKLINSTDLHIQYRMETGENFQWDRDANIRGTGYYATVGYDRNYSYWLEEKYLKLLNKNK